MEGWSPSAQKGGLQGHGDAGDSPCGPGVFLGQARNPVRNPWNWTMNAAGTRGRGLPLTGCAVRCRKLGWKRAHGHGTTGSHCQTELILLSEVTPSSTCGFRIHSCTGLCGPLIAGRKQPLAELVLACGHLGWRWAGVPGTLSEAALCPVGRPKQSPWISVPRVERQTEDSWYFWMVVLCSVGCPR